MALLGVLLAIFRLSAVGWIIYLLATGEHIASGIFLLGLILSYSGVSR